MYDEILEIFRIVAPDLEDVEDYRVLAMMEVCSVLISKSKFGKFYNQALAYLTAHKLKLNKMISEQGADSAGLLADGVTSEREGDLSRSYGFKSSGSDSSTADGDLDKTMYGKEFKAIKRQILVGVVTSLG